MTHPTLKADAVHKCYVLPKVHKNNMPISINDRDLQIKTEKLVSQNITKEYNKFLKCCGHMKYFVELVHCIEGVNLRDPGQIKLGQFGPYR